MTGAEHDPIPYDLLRWSKIQFALCQFANERFNETKDQRWRIAAEGSAQVLRPLLKAMQR